VVAVSKPPVRGGFSAGNGLGSRASARALIQEGRARERAGCVREAEEYYEGAITEARRTGEQGAEAEALRCLSIVTYQRGDRAGAEALCRQSVALATTMQSDVLAAEALNTLGVQYLQQGALREASDTFEQALSRGGRAVALAARVEQNLGILANIRGDLEAAEDHYARSLAAYQESNDQHGCGIAFHNLGIVSADREALDQADHYFEQSLEIARASGDVHLQALCLVNRAEVYWARQGYEAARGAAEEALVIFDGLGDRGAKADAYRIIGMVYRDTSRGALAESRLRSAIDLAAQSGSILRQAEAARELALLYQTMGRNQETLTLLNAAYRLFQQLDARVDLVNVEAKVDALETTYLAVVRQWGESIESADSYTYGHCERVASYAVAVAGELRLDEEVQTGIRLGAYLHDLGKVRVPHEILNKAGPLLPEEREVVELHPVWGVEMVADIEFPWDIKPIIRWHHEKVDGTGYPDRLRGEEIPVAAQIVGIVDIYDALTTTRSYRPAMTHEKAMHIITESRAWWSEPVYDAFQRALARLPATSSGDVAAAA
jgi:putative nucleotidyltransferase with HDIG domain